MKKKNPRPSAGQSARARAYALCKSLARSPDILEKFETEVRAQGIVGNVRNLLIVFLVLVSRLLKKPASIVIKGVSCTGKSEPVEAVLAFFPSTAYVEFTSMSDKALIYSKESFKHRIIVFQEEDGISEGASHLIRVLLSQGFIRHDATVREKGGGFATLAVTKEGPTGLITTTTSVSLHPENETRMLSLSASDSKIQTKNILIAQAIEDQRPAVAKHWHALQEWLALGPTEVSVPFATSIAALTSPDALRMRRDFRLVLTLIRAHALLHRKTRDTKADKIVANIADYRAIWKLVRSVVAEGEEVSASAATKATVNAVAKILAGGSVATLGAIAVALKLDKSTVSRRLKVAVASGYLKNLEIKSGLSANIVLGDPLPKRTDVLPSQKAVARHFAKAKKASRSPRFR